MADSPFNPEVAYYVTAFVDVLGQRGALAKLNKFPDPSDKAKVTATAQLVRETIGRVHHFREDYESFFEASRTQEVQIPGLDAEAREKIRQARQFDLLTHGLGDAMSLSVPMRVDSGPPLRPINGILVLLLGTCTSMLVALSRKFAIRGGVDIGLGAIMAQEEVYGAGLARSVYLEGAVAQWPRIVIGTELREYVSSVASTSPRGPTEAITHDLAKTCLRLMYLERDGLHCLDYFGEGARDIMSGGIMRRVYPDAVGWVESEVERFSSAGDIKLLTRYQLLLNYLSDRRHLWTEPASDV